MLSMIPLTMIVLAQATSGTTVHPSTEPIMQIGVFSYGPDGAVRAAAYKTDLAAESFQYVAGCALGGGNRPVPAEASDAWRLSGKVESLTADEAVVQLEWQRIRADGIAVSAPGGSVRLTLHPGDRVPLDSVNRSATAQCPAATIGFEARYGARSGASRIGGSGEPSRGVSIGAPGGSAGASAGGGGAAAGNAAGTGGGTGGGIAPNPYSRAVHMPKNQGTAAADAQPIDVDLWLVRSAPGREESAVHQALSGVRGGAQFAFAPLTIETRGGTLSVQVAGSFRLTGDEPGARQLIFSTTRAVRFAPTGPAGRDAPPVTTGRSVTTHAMPGPDDVLSFEMPALRVPNGVAAVPDRFSIRVRIR